MLPPLVMFPPNVRGDPIFIVGILAVSSPIESVSSSPGFLFKSGSVIVTVAYCAVVQFALGASNVI